MKAEGRLLSWLTEKQEIQILTATINSIKWDWWIDDSRGAEHKATTLESTIFNNIDELQGTGYPDCCKQISSELGEGFRRDLPREEGERNFRFKTQLWKRVQQWALDDNLGTWEKNARIVKWDDNRKLSTSHQIRPKIKIIKMQHIANISSVPFSWIFFLKPNRTN